MAANELSINQLSTVLNSICKQATGQTAIAVTDTSSFVTVAQATLKAGYDPVLSAISQVLSRTIFSIRPYNAKFKGLMADSIRYGNHVRKLQTIDKPFEDDVRTLLTDSYSVDQYVVNKPVVLQTNYYGEETFAKSLTIFRDQLDTAFSSPEEFQRFLAMVMGNASDMIEQAHENVARATLANFIGGKVAAEPDGGNEQVVHLLTEYNTETGLSIDAEDLAQPDTFATFWKWAYARIAEISAMMTERSLLYHTNITDKEIMRHTPANLQKVYLFNPFKFKIDSMVLSSAYHDNYLKYADKEVVNFWQSIKTPDTIKVKPVYMDATDGTLINSEDTITQDNVFGVIFDEEAVGITTVNQWSAPTPFNAKGGYSNMFWHFTDRYWNDFTENGVVLLLD